MKYQNRVVTPALRVALVFFVVSTLWVFLSDRILFWWLSDIEDIWLWQLVKGWFFIFTLGAVLYFLIKKILKQNYTLSEQVARKRALYRTITEKSLTAIVVIDEAGLLRYVNPAFCRTFNYQAHEVLGKSFTRFVPAGEGEARIEILRGFFQGEREVNGFYTVVNKQGETLMVYVDAVVIRRADGERQQLLFMNDVTAQQRAEQQMADSEKQYRMMMESLHDPVMIINREHHIYYANNAFREKFGEPPPDVPCHEFVFGNDQPCPLWDNYQMLEQSTGSVRIEDKRRGRIYKVNKVTLPGFGDEEQQMVVLHDLTDIIEAQKRAGESDRLKSSFLANMSHEVRTPLNSILGFSNLLLDQQITHEERNLYVGLIDQSGKQLLKVIDDVIDYSFIESGALKLKPARILVQKLIDDLMAYAQSRKEAYHKTDVEVIPDVELPPKCLYHGDARRIKQVCANLLDNSLKFTDKGFVCFKVFLNNSHLTFSVIDTGVGISSQNLEVVFERFRQEDEALSRSFGGSGLGLSISKELTHLMGGRIAVKSQLGKGTRVDVEMPLYQERPNGSG